MTFCDIISDYRITSLTVILMKGTVEGDDPVSPPGRRAANAVRKETAVRRAALELSEEVGFSAVSMADIADRSGVTERTIFRTFGTKAGIFWHEPFLARLVRYLDPAAAALDPLAAVSSAAAGAANEMSQEERHLEARRRALILSEPDLLGVGALSLGRSIGDLTQQITPPEVDADRQRRLALFALFAAMAIAFVPLDADKPIDDWISRLRDALSLAALGPLSPVAGDRPRRRSR